MKKTPSKTPQRVIPAFLKAPQRVFHALFKTPRRAILVLSIALLCVVLAIFCILAFCKTPTLKNDNGGFLNPQTGVSYTPTSPNYFAKPSGETAYARIKIKGAGEDILLYEIDGIDPEHYLADTGHSVYAAAGKELPELYDLPCTRVGIYDTQVSSNDGNITDAKEILALKELHKSGSYVALNTIGYYIEQSTWYDLRFMGDGDYNGIYFELKYGVFEEEVIVTEFLEKDANGHMIDLYPGVPSEIDKEEYNGQMYDVIRYNFGKEILCDYSTGNCYSIQNSLLSYITPVGE